MDADYTKRELDDHFNQLNKRFDRQDIQLGELVSQTKKTNGRVNRLENWRWFLTGMGVLITVILVPIIIALITNHK